MFLGLLQIFSWILVGYNVKSHNWWGVVAFTALSLVAGLISVVKALVVGDKK